MKIALNLRQETRSGCKMFNDERGSGKELL
jgi:hypothetical protein